MGMCIGVIVVMAFELLILAAPFVIGTLIIMGILHLVNARLQRPGE
jgi:hypothetical protein